MTLFCHFLLVGWWEVQIDDADLPPCQPAGAWWCKPAGLLEHAHGQLASCWEFRRRARSSAIEYIIAAPPPNFEHFFFFSLALFAFWLRSSVVSVLFSLISETTLRSRIVIIPIFVSRRTSLWACPWLSATVSLVSHCLQATRTLFHCTLGLCSGCEEED